MKSISIKTQKRTAKIYLYYVALFITLIIAISLGVSLVSKFSWINVGLVCLIALGIYSVAEDLTYAVKYQDVQVVAELKDDDTVLFYNTASNGKKWNESEHKLSNISRIYILKKKKKAGLIENKFLEYKCKDYTIVPTTEIEILPSLLNATDEDINKLLYFLHQQQNQIQIGYMG